LPELPEVETIKRTLTPLLMGKKISQVNTIREDVIKHPQAKQFVQEITDRNIVNLSRRGKYLTITFADGNRLVVHLRMTGRMLYCSPLDEQKPHTHVIFGLSDGNELRFSDVRRFGCLWLLESMEEDCCTGMVKLGPEPFDEQFCPQYLADLLAKKKTTIKQALLDQRVLAGLGNIYTDEVLFRAAMHPQMICSQISLLKVQKIVIAVRAVLTEAIQHKGTTFRDYLDGMGEKGAHQLALFVYQREGELCRVCKTPIQRIKVAGRSTFFCPNCQK